FADGPKTLSRGGGFRVQSTDSDSDGNNDTETGNETGPFIGTDTTAQGNEMIAFARKFLGVPYVFGTDSYSSGNRSFDCSTFTGYVYGKFGVDLPRTARAQSKLGDPVARDELKKGDLLFFSVPGRFKSDDIVGHVGIYMGNGQMIHA